MSQLGRDPVRQTAGWPLDERYNRLSKRLVLGVSMDCTGGLKERRSDV